MSCIPASHSEITVLNPDSSMEEIPRRGSRVYQLFPESPSATGSESGSFSDEMREIYRRERLPSIVLEPTEQSDHEGEEQRLPRRRWSGEQIQEDDRTSVPNVGEQREERATEERSIFRKSSIGPAQNQMSPSRLTPPPSPTSPEDAPPCLRNQAR